MDIPSGKILLLLAAVFAAHPAFADKPDREFSGQNKHEGRKNDVRGADHRERDFGHSEKDRRQARQYDDRAPGRPGSSPPDRHNGWSGGHGERYFSDHQHLAVREYYVAHYRSGGCPPGLAKKRNGCLPPGQAKKWRMGYPLPRDVIYYDLPPSLVISLGMPPAGYRYVRVAGDILLIAIGTGLVIDAIQDLGRM